MYHSSLIHSSIDVHLGYFHVLAIVNNTSVNIEIHVSFSFMVSSGYTPSSGIGGLYCSFIASFFRHLHTVCHSGCTNLIYHQQCKSFFFSMPSPAFIVCGLFDDGHSDQCEIIPHYSFDLHFSN